ncbi:YciI family protein [Stutzerimonas urumqiensis]|uniref:YciI family protein n=1 Tax=Stutzerimonas urumqiensis TaxID=638269 RepID=UPI003DA4681E
MNYLCLIYLAREALDHPVVAEALDEQTDACLDTWRQRAVLLAGGPLQPSEATTTLRLRHGQLLLDDDPVAPADELVRFCLIEARDLNDAIRLAASLPCGRLGGIRIHPVAPSRTRDTLTTYPANPNERFTS